VPDFLAFKILLRGRASKMSTRMPNKSALLAIPHFARRVFVKQTNSRWRGLMQQYTVNFLIDDRANLALKKTNDG
jgi:thiamine monophosphate synthase